MRSCIVTRRYACAIDCTAVKARYYTPVVTHYAILESQNAFRASYNHSSLAISESLLESLLSIFAQSQFTGVLQPFAPVNTSINLIREHTHKPHPNSARSLAVVCVRVCARHPSTSVASSLKMLRCEHLKRLQRRFLHLAF